jgi:hypothetical protein
MDRIQGKVVDVIGLDEVDLSLDYHYIPKRVIFLSEQVVEVVWKKEQGLHQIVVKQKYISS